MFKQLKKVKGFEKTFPHMMSELAKGNVWAWDDRGYTRTLTETNVNHIKVLEETDKEYGTKVYAVLDNYMWYTDGQVHMVSYLYVSNERGDVSPYAYDSYYAIAEVVNDSWGICERGSVIIEGSPGGGPRRI